MQDFRINHGKFTKEHFDKFSTFIKNNFGIYYSDIKAELLRIKIDKCLIKSGINNYDDFYRLITDDKNYDYIKLLIDQITVNKTEFFRENMHFEFILNNMDYILRKNNKISENNEIKAWSMACSTGQEAYSLAITLKEAMPSLNIKILATDLSYRVLKKANTGIYDANEKKLIKTSYISRYFKEENNNLIVTDSIKKLITFRQFNLKNDFPINGCFDIIFLRNVMIYFDEKTHQQIINKIYNCLNPGGLLFIGQSESLIKCNHSFKHIKSSIYQK